MTRRLVVIGNGMAATRLVQRLVERDPARFAITVVGDEPQDRKSTRLNSSH